MKWHLFYGPRCSWFYIYMLRVFLRCDDDDDDDDDDERMNINVA